MMMITMMNILITKLLEKDDYIDSTTPATANRLRLGFVERISLAAFRVWQCLKPEFWTR